MCAICKRAAPVWETDRAEPGDRLLAGRYSVSPLFLQVHDEIVFQFPVSNPMLAWDAMQYMEEDIEVRGRIMRIPSGLSVGRNWGEMVEVETFEELKEVTNKLTT